MALQTEMAERGDNAKFQSPIQVQSKEVEKELTKGEQKKERKREEQKKEQKKEEQKKELFGLMLGACVADDFLDFREFGILEAAANVLLIEQEQMFAYIDFFLDADIQSNVDLP